VCVYGKEWNADSSESAFLHPQEKALTFVSNVFSSKFGRFSYPSGKQSYYKSVKKSTPGVLRMMLPLLHQRGALSFLSILHIHFSFRTTTYCKKSELFERFLANTPPFFFPNHHHSALLYCLLFLLRIGRDLALLCNVTIHFPVLECGRLRIYGVLET
jgi:hypothetical protein